MDTTQQLRGLKETIDKAVEAKRTARNEADRRFIVANIGQDLVTILTPLMQQIALGSRINRDELKSIIQTIRFEAPQVTVGSPKVNVKAPEVNVTTTPIEFPKDELISAIQKAILKVKFPKTEVKVDAPKIPDKVKVEQMKELIDSVKKFADVQYSLDINAIYAGVNNDTAKPLPVILTDEKGKFYKALMTAISGGGGGGGSIDTSVSTPVVSNTLLASADTEYSVILSKGTKKFKIYAVNSTRITPHPAVLRYSYTSLGNGSWAALTCIPIPAGNYEYVEGLELKVPTTLYFSSPTGGNAVVVVIAWQ